MFGSRAGKTQVAGAKGPGGSRHEPQLAQTALHDAIEDRGNAYESPFQVEPRTGRDALKRDIELQFGTTVLAIVRQCTDDEYLPAGRPAEKGTPEEWRVRKEAYLASLRKKTDVPALRVSCADKLHNARAILADYETEGERLWQRFNVKWKAEQLWYYEGLAAAFADRSRVLGDAGLQRLARQLAATVAAIARHEP
jgi:(p)ppGpp synthase/HD superfamily hydrolase